MRNTRYVQPITYTVKRWSQLWGMRAKVAKRCQQGFKRNGPTCAESLWREVDVHAVTFNRYTHDFLALRPTPAENKKIVKQPSSKQIIAGQTLDNLLECQNMRAFDSSYAFICASAVVAWSTCLRLVTPVCYTAGS